ncbi:MAG: conserved rane protein of unknown function [Modestobacter sp.]|nr:conserved rane protein of unknown function [Modestobacter sp.]
MSSSTVPDAVPAAVVPPTRSVPGRRRTPATVAAAGALAVVESLALLAVGLTGLDGLFGTGLRPDGGLVALTLLLLAGWVVLCAGGGASLVDGAGRLLLVAVSCGEIALLLVLAGAGALGVDGVALVAPGPLGALPLPVLTLLAVTVPIVKLLLAGSDATADWLAAGPHPRVHRPAQPPRYRVARGVTVGVIGLALTAFSLVSSPAHPAVEPAPAAVDSTR